MTANTEAIAVASLTQKPFVETIQSVPVLLTPTGEGAWQRETLEKLLPQPTRKTGSYTLHDDDSFIQFCKRHGSLSSGSAIYLNADYAHNKIEAVAIFNDNADGDGPSGWKDFKANFTPRKTKQWDDWLANNGKKMSQLELANFFEQNISDFASVKGMPSGSDVLTFVTHMQETRTVKYGSALNLQNGMVQLEFVEDSDKAEKGKIELFKEFSLGISPFFGGAPYQIDSFLRYRIDRQSGAISFAYELKKPEKVLEAACADMIKKIKESTGLPLFFGQA